MIFASDFAIQVQRFSEKLFGPDAMKQTLQNTLAIRIWGRTFAQIQAGFHRLSPWANDGELRVILYLGSAMSVSQLTAKIRDRSRPSIQKTWTLDSGLIC